ncbi:MULTISPECIES: DsbA family protein [unclassified Roseitalea]|uniref:DsbA family protein n=1 Tax=unclassified Roseitalea TaxID=2639107 RepID=UPI00273DBC24|nr:MULTISPECIES: DsbA family protein [unclassified Roseitalea]
MPRFAAHRRTRPLIALIAAAGMLGVAGMAASAQDSGFSEAERAEIGEIVRQYLLANPEVMLDVQRALEDQQAAQELERRKQVIAAAGEELFRNPSDPVLGNPAGDVTVVEFFDYNCGFCRRAMADMDALIESDPGVRFVLKEFPILGQDSQAAHRVAMAFHRVMPESYGVFHERLMNTQERANEQNAMAIALDLGADEAALRSEMDHPAIAASIESTYRLAEALGISGTPSYVIGNELVPGAMGESVLRDSVHKARTCAETAC